MLKYELGTWEKDYTFSHGVGNLESSAFPPNGAKTLEKEDSLLWFREIGWSRGWRITSVHDLDDHPWHSSLISLMILRGKKEVLYLCDKSTVIELNERACRIGAICLARALKKRKQMTGQRAQPRRHTVHTKSTRTGLTTYCKCAGRI